MKLPIYVKRVDLGEGVDICPLPEELEWFDEWDTSPRYERVLAVYTAIQRLYNYYQTNTPTAFGNPEYSYLRGYLVGLLSGIHYNMEECDGKVTVTDKHGKKILIVEVPVKTKNYADSIKDINNTLRNLGL